MNKSVVTGHYKSQREIALLLGISEQAVSQWPEIIPEGAALKLEKLTNGELKYDASLYPKGRRRAKRAA
ncbi:Cro/CI family transcriptional regulator [Serratia liquefaciens]|uniref:Cro/CI family transcriptional regulator n=1 Tax=Serratia liquefaciens TaxID=614 RepID=UPI003906806A